MNPSNPNPTDADDDLVNDPTVLLYHRILSTETTPPSLDKAILENYRRSFKPHFWKRWFYKLNLNGDLGFNWQMAGALAVGLMVGIFVQPPLEKSAEDETKAFKGGTTEPVTNNQDVTKNPQIWLAKIADLVYEGDIKQAEQELVKFKQLYPDYPPQSR